MRVAAVAAAAFFLVSWTLIHHGWFERDQLVDTPVYATYGQGIADGRLPYRDFAVEYPPAALPVFALPAWGAHYRRHFEWLMAACGVGIVLLTAASLHALRATSDRATTALALLAISPLLVGSLVLTRFDLWPSLLVAGALTAFLRERDAVGGALLGLAVAAKLYPAVLVPVALVWVWRRRGRRRALQWSSLVAGVVALCFLPFVLLAPHGVAHSLTTQLGRPLQVESLGSSVLMAAHHLFGLALHGESSHGSQNLAGAAPDAAAALSTGLQLLALAAVWILFARGPATRERLVTAFAAAVVCFVAFGKVFSPQFVIWLLPVVPLVRRQAASLLLVAALVLTQTWFPQRYWPLALEFRTPQVWFLLARDLAVVALALVLQHDLLREDGARREAVEPVRAEVEAGAA